MRVRHVSSLLLLQSFLPPASGKKGHEGLLQRRHSAMRFQNNREIPDCSLSRFPTCTHEDSPFHPFSLRPQRMHHRIFRGWSRFCARARALARHPLQMFVCPERWGDFPQTRRPVSRPASLAFCLSASIYFLVIYIFWESAENDSKRIFHRE